MANKYTKLFIDNQEIDLYDAEQLPLNVKKRVNNIKGSVQGDYSRSSVTVPATKNNISILGRSRAYFSFRIEVDGSPDFNGTAQVRKGKTFSQGYAAIEENYEINLISNNSSWFVLLGETLLGDLTTEIVNFSQANVITGFTSAPSLRNWAFCLIKWKEWANFVGGTHYAPSVFESTPALYIKPLIEEAFNSIGYTVQSDFFDTDMFEKLILPTPIPNKLPAGYNQEYLNTEVSISAPVVLSGGFFAFPFDTIDVAAPQNPTAFDNTTNYDYTAPLTGYYEIDIAVTFNTTAPPAPYILVFGTTINGTPVVPDIGFGFNNNPATAPPYPTTGIPQRANGVVFLNKGDVLVFGYTTSVAITADSATMKIKGEAIFEPLIDVDFKYFLHDWKFLDMLKGLTIMFNLTFETDESSRIVTIEPKDSYLNTDRIAALSEVKEGFYQYTTKDYSKLIDYEKVGSFEFPEMEGRFDYKYNADDEETIKWIEGINDIKIYESRFPIENGDTSKTKIIEVPFFAKTIHVFDTETRYPATNKIPQFPLIYPQNYFLDPTATEADKDVSPRIFYHAGVRYLSNPEIDGAIELLEAPGIQQALPMTFMVNYNDTTGLDPNLGFDNQEINGTNSVGLMQRFYLQELARNNIGELRKNYVRFNSIDNLNFTFRIKGIIDGQRYIVQELEGYNPLKDAPTQFKFYLDVYPDSDDVAAIINSPLTGVVTLEAQ